MIALAPGPLWQQWSEANLNNFKRMENEAPKVYTRMMAAVKKALGAKPEKAPAKKAAKAQKAQPELKDDPEQYLKWLEERCKAEQNNSTTDYFEFAKSQGAIIAAGFPPDQAAANDIIKKHAPQ